jgi:hypothetical protein
MTWITGLAVLATLLMLGRRSENSAWPFVAAVAIAVVLCLVQDVVLWLRSPRRRHR